MHDFGLVTPPEFKFFSECLGWCGKAVDSLADRLVFRTFREDNFDLNTIYQMNKPGRAVSFCDPFRTDRLLFFRLYRTG